MKYHVSVFDVVNSNKFTPNKSVTKWNGAIYTAQLLRLKFIGLFKVITWVQSRLPTSKLSDSDCSTKNIINCQASFKQNIKS